MAVTPDLIHEQAELVARENREGNPEIVKVYWFPSPDEVRLVETMRDLPVIEEDRIYPFYWPPRPEDGVLVWSGIALILPEEVGQVPLPPEWGRWEDAVELV
jgi:hypothetical protein